jgi:hypothetical protein
MAFIGFEDDVDFAALPAGDYFIVEETGEVYDDEHGAEDACFSSSGATDDDEETFDDMYQISTYRKETVPPYIVTRQRAWQRDYASVNIGRDWNHVPPGLLVERPGYRDQECATYAEALAVAKEYAARWAADLNEPVQIEDDTAECMTWEAAYTALPSGLLFSGEPEMCAIS